MSDLQHIHNLMTNPGEMPRGYKDNAISVIKRAIPKNLIKSREQGGVTLDYIGGDTVINLLNEAFGYTWSFEILDERIIATEPKPKTVWNSQTKKKEPVMDTNGKQVMEEQPPIYQVRGRLIIPGFGIKEQYGTKVIIGGSSEQEGVAKAAATDALKKCATLVGIGLELYGDKEVNPNEHKSSYGSRDKGGYSKSGYSKSNDNERSYSTTANQAGSPEVNPWSSVEKEVTRLKELKAIIGINDNAKLNPFVVEFTGSKDATYELVTPSNIAAFNKFLEKKAENA